MDAEFAAPSGWERPDLGRSGPGVYRLIRASHRALLRTLHRSLHHPEQAQQRALEQVLRSVADSRFAREHGLGSVRTPDALRRAVPVRSHDDLRPWLDEVYDGNPAALLGTRVTRFVSTSGTTGAPKHLPVTETWARQVADAQSLWVLAALRSQPELATGRVLTVAGAACEHRSPTGLPVGSNTGRMRARQPWWLRRRYALPSDLHTLADPEVRHYALLRLALAQDVRSWTTANPSMVLRLCRLAREHWQALSRDVHDGTLCNGPGAEVPAALARRWRPARARLPESPLLGQVWDLAAVNCWTGGAAAWFLEQLPEALGARPVLREVGISSSEGYFAIPLHPTWRGGLLWCGGHLLEGITEAGEALWPWQWQVGETVRLVVSTTAGLVRYDLDDHLEVVGRWGRVPLVRFVGRGRDTVSIVGEKLTAAQLAEAIHRQAAPVAFVGHVAHAEVPAWELVTTTPVEPGRLDADLCALNGEYASKRKSGRLAALTVRTVPPAAFAAWELRRHREGAADGQLKLPLVLGPGQLPPELA